MTTTAQPEYEYVAYMGDGGWDWSEFRVVYKDGFYYWDSQSGCSCDGWYSNWENADRGTKHEALREVRESGFSDAQIDSAVQEILAFRPGGADA